MTEERLRVLLLDDEESVRMPLKIYLEKNFGYHVDAVANGEEALRLVEEAQGHYDVALLDEVILPGPDGVEVMQQIKAHYPDIEAIVFTGWGSESRQRALQAGAFRYLEKPFDIDDLAMLIRTAAQQVRLRDISRAILSERDLDRVLEGINVAACSLALADEAAIALLDRVTGRIRVHTKTYAAEQEWRKHFKDQDLFREIIQNGQVVRVPDTMQDDRVDQKVRDDGIRSFLGVPVPGEGGNLGVLYTYSQRPGRFDEWGAVAVLQTLAGQAGLAIANAQAFQQIQAHAGYMEALVRVGQGLTRTTRVGDQLALAWDFVREQLQVSTFFVALYDETTGAITFPIYYDKGKPVSRPDRPLGTGRNQWGITGYVIGKGEELYWPTVENLENGCASLGIRPGKVGDPSQSCFFLPLRAGSRIIGALSIQSYDRYSFSPILLDACRALASQLTVALENARLVTETQRWAADLETLQRLSTTIASSLELNQVMEQTCQAAVKFFRVDHSSLVLFEPDLTQGRVTAEYPPDLKTLCTLIPLQGVPDEEKLVNEGEPLVVYDVASEEALGPVREILYNRFNIHSILIVPVTSKGKRLGSFSLDAIGHKRQFTRQEVELCKMFAAQVAVAIENARRMRELEHMRRAAEAMASALEASQVLQQIVESAREVLQADSSTIWSYDNVRDQFISEELVAYGMPVDELERFRKTVPKRGGTTDTVMDMGWVGVTDVYDPRYDFMDPSTLELLDSIGTKSFQGIALKVGYEKLGVLYVNYNRPRSFPDEDRRILETFAYHAALALKKARLLEQVGKARDAARVVAEVSALGDLEHTLDSIVKGTQEVLSCDAVTLYTYDQERDEFGFPPAMAGVRDEGEVLKLGRVAKQSVVGNILALNKTYEAEDAPSDQLMLGSFVHREGIMSSVGIPLQVGDRKVGVMFVNYRSRHCFTEDELTNIELFANQAAVAIRNAQLYQAEQRHAQALKAMQAISAAVSAVLDLDILLPMITDRAAEIFNAPASSLMLWDERQENLVIRAAFGLGDEYQRRQCISRNKVYELVGEFGLRPHVFDIYHEPIGDAELVSRERLYTVLTTPLTIGNELVGTLDVYSKGEPRRFGENEEELATIFANHAAIAIQNARSYEELKRTKGLVGARTAVAWMGMVSAAWRHSVGNYATTIEDLVKHLHSDLNAGAPISKLKQRLADIEGMVNKIRETPITAPLSTEEGVESVLINDLIREWIKQLWDWKPYKSVQHRLNLALEERATVRASSEWLRRVLDILIDNAVEAMAKSAEKQLTVTTRLADGGAEIAIADTGRGIPEDVLPKLFLEPVRKPKGAKGLGVGLLMAQTIVQTYGGEIRVVATGPTGTTIVIWLPLEA